MNNLTRVGIDIDGPMYELYTAVTDIVGMETQLQEWEFYREWGWTEEEFNEFYADAILNKDLLNRVPASYGVKTTMELLKNMGYELVLCTVRGVGLADEIKDAAQQQTVDWLQQNKVPYDELIFSTNKTDARSFCFFDDNIQNYEAVARTRSCVSWLYSLPYNERHHAPNRVHEFRHIPSAVVWSRERIRRSTDNNGGRLRRKTFLV